MTDMDWADEITAKIDLQMQATWNVAPIAAAIRQAKAAGMREAADLVYEYKRDFEVLWRDDLNAFLKDAASKLDPPTQ